jgi:hypothetical protein
MASAITNKHFRFNFLAFLLAFMIGIFYVYVDTPKQRMIIKYPTPYNVDKMVYRGLNDECYKFRANEVKCTDKALEQPII